MRRVLVLEDEELLLAVLNSSPADGDRRRKELAGDAGARLAQRFGGTGSAAEIARLRRVRNALQRVVGGDVRAVGELAALAEGVALAPEVEASGLRWRLTAPADEHLAARVLVAWSEVQRALPNRLRACANAECNLFLIDHSRPGTAKWCSMATCGNRMKARAHAQRARRG